MGLVEPTPQNIYSRNTTWEVILWTSHEGSRVLAPLVIGLDFNIAILTDLLEGALCISVNGDCGV